MNLLAIQTKQKYKDTCNA